MKLTIRMFIGSAAVMLLAFCVTAGTAITPSEAAAAAVTQMNSTGTLTAAKHIVLDDMYISSDNSEQSIKNPCPLPVAQSTEAPAPSQLVLANVNHTFKSHEYKISEQVLYQYSEEEKEYIARVVYAEARGESFEGQIAVAAVVINRFESGLYGSTVRRVVKAPNQFAVSSRYNDEVMRAVEEAIATRGTYPDNMYYFQVSKSKSWYDFVYYDRIGNHSFYCASK